MISNPDFDKDSFIDIVMKDSRYNPNAYAFLMMVLEKLSADRVALNAKSIMEGFRALAIDLWGPMAYFVLNELGVKRCEDIGEMMFNLCDSGRIGGAKGHERESYADGYDFEEEFKRPYDCPED
ncbi:MAG: hypothetical protein IJQ34_03880 [Kiritimatiellae bacterium]|nr:hypothetical protein [Kiritimatiellia bacterium]